MNAEIIAVGSELLTPQRLDTNSLYLTEHLNDLGVELVTKSVLGDDRERLASAVRLAAGRNPIVILTGGLGPTEDDVTRDAVAAALGRRLVFHDEIARQIQERFARAGRVMAEINKRQAFVVEGAEILPNDRGTAPGQWIEDGGVCLMLLPGPPNELKAMWERQCLPRLARIVPKQTIRTVCLRVAGMAESDVDQLIAPVYKKYDNPATTILAAAGDIQVHLRARCVTEAEGDALLAEVAGQIDLLLGDRIYSRNGAPLEATVGELLRQRRATLAVAESCTAGLLADRFASVPGASDYLLGGFITYSNAMKVELLGVSPELLAQHGAVSAETAEAMAAGALRRTGATHALAITGEAGPTPAGPAPVGLCYVAAADAAGTQVAHRQFIGDRNRIRSFAAQMALDLLRRRLTKM